MSKCFYCDRKTKNIEFADVKPRYVCERCQNELKLITRLNNQIAELKKQIAEKDKKIEKLTDALMLNPDKKKMYELQEDNVVHTFVKAKLKEQRHDICEKIREEVTERAGIDYKWMTMSVLLEDLVDILDQIEKGE